MAHTSNAVAVALEAVRRTTAAQAATINALEHAFDAEMAQLASDRQALEDDRAAFLREIDDKLARDAEEKARMKASAPPPNDVVKLNVGGARFETSRAVLTKVEDSMLGRMFGRCDAMLQADPLDGSIFIDRDGARFRLILDFLRGDPLDGIVMQRAVYALPEAAQEALVQELDYFGLEVSVFGVRPWTDGAAFRPGPAMIDTRAYCAAVAAGGRVVVFGGHSDMSALESTELLDTRTMAFTAGPDMLTARYGCAAVQIDGNRVLVMGGTGEDGENLNTTEILHLSTLTFIQGPTLLSSRRGCAVVALDARRVLVVGGENGSSQISSTEILSLDTMAFAPGPYMATPRSGCAAVALDEHRVMVAGGSSDSGYLATTEVLDFRTMAFAPGPSMGAVREGCAAVPVDARHVLFIGGLGGSATTELLDVAALEFSPGPALLVGRWGVASTRLDTAEEDARILVVGGIDDNGASWSTTEVLVFDHPRSARAFRRVAALRAA